MGRIHPRWSGDWNGRGEPLADALTAVRKALSRDDFRFAGHIVWDHGRVVARYDNLPDIRERLGYSAPPSDVTLRLWIPAKEGSMTKDERLRDDFLGSTPAVGPYLEVQVEVTTTQVEVAATGENPFTVQAAFKAARRVIESKAVTKVPHHMRDGDAPSVSSRWTRTMGWIEKHPTVATGVVGLSGVAATVAGIVVGS